MSNELLCYRARLAPEPLFLVSMGRAGSTLLYALLNKHPQVALTFEADLLCLRTVFAKPRRMLDWRKRWEFHNQALSRHGLMEQDLPAYVRDCPSAFRAAHQVFAQKKGATIWGDKSPSYFDRLDWIAREFPHARFIILWRSPHDTVNAVLRAEAAGSAHFKRKGSVTRELFGYELLKTQCDRLIARAKAVLQLNYEDLLEDTEGTMREVCRFLRIPYLDCVSSLEGADRSAIWEGQHHAYARGNVIVREKRPDLVSPSLRAKITRYVSWWHHKHGTLWPPRPLSDSNCVPGPSALERLLDAGRFRLVRAKDKISWIAFAFVPLWILQLYRSLRRGRNVFG